MTKVLIYLNNNPTPVSFEMLGGVTQNRNEFLRLMRANEFFSVVTENGAIILQSKEVAAIYCESS